MVNQRIKRGKIRAIGLLVATCQTWMLAGTTVWAQTPASAASLSAGGANDKVVVSGVVPDEATRSAIVARLRELYGAQRVVDQLGVDKLVAPPNWNQHIQRVHWQQ